MKAPNWIIISNRRETLDRFPEKARPWHSSDVLPLINYDVVFVDAAYDESESHNSHQENHEFFAPHRVFRFLKHNGKLVWIGDPSVPFGSYAFIDILQPGCMNKLNKEVHANLLRFQAFFGKIFAYLKHSDFTFHANSYEFQDVLDPRREFEFSLLPLAVHNSTQPVAGILAVRERKRPKDFTSMENGQAIIIPYPRSRQAEFWNLLFEAYGCREVQEAAHWLADFCTSAEGPVILEEREMEAAISSLENELLEIRNRKGAIREWYQLIAAHGLELENVVASWFEQLGCRNRSELIGDSDGVFELPSGSLVLVECKGYRKGGMNEEGLDQLMRNRPDIERSSNVEISYCVLCVNFDRDNTPDNRKPDISPRIRRRLDLESYCLIDTRYMLNIVLSKLESGQVFDIDEFFKKHNKRALIYDGQSLGTDQPS